jgi:hypothetical protein
MKASDLLVHPDGPNKGLVLCGSPAWPSELEPGDVVQFEREPTRFVRVATALAVPGLAAHEPDGARLSFSAAAFGLVVGEWVTFSPRLVVPQMSAVARPGGLVAGMSASMTRLEWDTYFWRVPHAVVEGLEEENG